MRPPCSEKDYFQIHAACDSEGRVSSLRRALFSFTAPPPSPLWGFFCRRRCCIDGWSLKSAWRTPQALWRCLRWGRESRALPATPATTTATTPPVYRVHLEPTQMAPTVTLDCSLGNTKPFLSVLEKCTDMFWTTESAHPPASMEEGTSFLCLNMAFCVCVPECTACPAGTEPVLGYEYKWWNVLPSNMKTSCFNVGNSKCDNMNGEMICIRDDFAPISAT